MKDLYTELERLSKGSDFSATLSQRGGYVTFSNSGRRGGTKYFQIGLDNLLQTLKDILENITEFAGMTEYVESDWRNNGSAYFKDPVANANSTVQTKPLFSTLSKLIIWGNQPTYDGVDSDQEIVLDEEALRNTIDKLEAIADAFKPARTTLMTSPKAFETTTQKIYYGCPGTGKSREVKSLTSGINNEKLITFDDGTTNVFRTTFHPDYDYSTFVGCYKPVKEDGVLDYKFVPQVFTNAYVAAKKHPDTPVYLIIEEINRGNCAQIFGDLFQLLDRKDGKSEFPIDAEQELMKYLRDVAELEDYAKIELPANFNIYATMNTSDQSLFPMDSAFKRRWDMKYVKIDYNKDAAKFTFNVNGKDYHWLDYLPCFNDKITDASDSEDKQMGEFFIRGNMNAEEFKNKVMFYLWNDVCKDLYAGNNSPQSFFFRDIYGKPFKFTQLFNEPGPDATDEDKKDPYKNGDLLLEGFLYYVMNGKKKAPKPVAEATAADTDNDDNGADNE